MSNNREAYKTKLLAEMTRHVGRARAVPMTQLYRAVFGKDYRDKINDTRKLRDLVTELRHEGVPIMSYAAKDAGGYYLAAASSELVDYCDRLKRQALKKLAIVSKIKNTNLPTLLGQLTLELEKLNDGYTKRN